MQEPQADFFEKVKSEPDFNVLPKETGTSDDTTFNEVLLAQQITQGMNEQGVSPADRDILNGILEILNSSLAKQDKLIKLARQFKMSPVEFASWVNTVAETTFIRRASKNGISTVKRIIEKMQHV